MRKWMLLLALIPSTGMPHVSLEAYCKEKGGMVENMGAQFQQPGGIATGFTRAFCNFHIHGGFVSIGLDSFADDKPNIAASFAQTLAPIVDESPLWKGPFANPSLNVCKNLGGSNIGFNTFGGGFSNALGQVDICVFGDTSMISGWSLIYIANGREGYDAIKNNFASKPLRLSDYT